MEEPVKERFLYFSLQNDGDIKFDDDNKNNVEFILPRHPETNVLDVYYLQTMLKYFDGSKDILENEILDAFPVISLAKDKDNKFYKLSLYRLREFYKNEIEEDVYIQASVKHLYMHSLLATPTNQSLKKVIEGCLDKVTPVMYHNDQRDTVDDDKYILHRLASYVPTSRYKVMKLLKGWIEGALHFYEYSIMFFDCRFVGFDDFTENIIDIKTEDLFQETLCYSNTSSSINIYSTGSFIVDDLGEYYCMELIICDLKKRWLFTSPCNDNERDGKVIMFRNKDLRMRLEEILTGLFQENSFRLNEVFKWNRYLKGGRFDSHYDTMFVNTSSEECSLYSLLIYMDVIGETIMYLYGENEVQVRLESNRAYIIPHWVRHRVEGKNKREFIKTEIVFKNKYPGTDFDQTLADAFDESCYYMLQSIRHPELKDIVSKNFNTINEARFYKTTYVPKLISNIFFSKTIYNLPLQYYHNINESLIETFDVKFNYITDGIYYYFKIKNTKGISKPVVPRNEAIMMLSLMQLDIQPRKIFQRTVRKCECSHTCTEDYYKTSEFIVEEKITYWQTDERDAKIADALECVQFPSDIGNIHTLGNISILDVPLNPKTFYFAACQNIYACHDLKQILLTEITAPDRDANYKNVNVDFIGPEKNVIKIRQHSFKNGVVIKRKWITL